MSNEIRKNGKVYSSTSPIDHEQMKNRLGVGRYGEAYHLNVDEYRYVQATMAGAPLAPVNVSPTDGELNVYQYPEFVGSAYRSPRDTPMLGLEILICSDAEMTNTIYQGYAETAQTSARFQDFETLIAVDTTYFWSVRYVDIDERRGNWSPPTSFSTAAAFEPTVILRPRILYPEEGARVSPVDPLLIGSQFGVIGAPDSHESSDWQIARYPDFDASNIIAESLDDAANKTSIVFDGLNLSGDSGIYARMRHTALTAGKSQWSPIRHAPLREYYNDPLIGVAFRRSDPALPYTGRYIDIYGNTVNPSIGYFNNHPLYQFPLVQPAGQMMRMLPEVHVRCAHDIDGDAYRYWISPEAFDGSYLHPAFRLSSGPLLIGSYMCNNESGNAVVNGTGQIGRWETNYTNITHPIMADHLNTNADASHSGWHVENVYEYALRTLMVIMEFKRFDVQSVLSAENDNFNFNVNNPSKRQWRGFFDPFLATNSAGIVLIGFKRSRLSGDHDIRIGLPTNPETLATLYTSDFGGTNANSAQPIDTFKTGYNSSIECDLDLLFIPDTTGNGVGASGAKSTGTYSSRNTAAFMGSESDKIVGCFYDQGIATTSGSAAYVRIIKYTV